MSDIKLIYFEGCPNAKHARAALLTTGVDFEVIKQNELPEESPFKGYSSPTILRGSSELICGSKAAASSCSFGEIKVDEIKAKLKTAPAKKGLLTSIGAFGSSLLVGFCPVCVPAIGAFLSSIGLGFLVNMAVLEPLLVGLLVVTLIGLYWSYIKEHGKVAPFVLGSAMATSMYVGRYIFIESTLNLALVYGGIAGIMGAATWNLWLRKNRSCNKCSAK